MTVRQQFQKALMLLDRGSIDRGEDILYQVIIDAEYANDQVALIQGLVCLGSILYETDRVSEARPYLERALKEIREGDVLEYELSLARELLSRSE